MDSKEKLRDEIVAEKAKGNIVFHGLDGYFAVAAIDRFVEQPADGMLYDLNRLEEVSMTFLDDPKWVNDYAAAQVIRKLVQQRDELRTILKSAALEQPK